jgi:hypothetical protein
MIAHRRIYVAPKLELLPPTLENQVAGYLRGFWPAMPDKHIRMNASGPKYSWVKDKDDQHIPLTYTDLLSHAAGDKMIGAHLHNAAGLCRIGMLDIDEGGRPAVAASVAAALSLGYHAYGIYMPGKEHDGGRLVVPFAEFADYRSIRTIMEQIRDEANLSTKEIWPGGGNAVALPLGRNIRKGTRGELLMQSGEIVYLDQDLHAGIDLLLAMPSNAAPPVSNVNQVNSQQQERKQATDKTDYTQSERTNRTPEKVDVTIVTQKKADATVDATVATIKKASGRIDTKAIGAAVRERYNESHDWPDLLSQYGGVEMRPGYWACNCGVDHEHDIQLAVTSQDKLISLSNRCKWASKDKAGDQFSFECDRAHGGNYRAAVEAKAREYGLWQEPRRASGKRLPDPPLVEPEHRFSQEQRDAYNAQRRARRLQENTEVVETWRGHLGTLEQLPGRAHLLGEFLYGSFDGTLQVRPTNEQIAEAIGLSERSIQYAFADLTRAGLGKRHGGRGGLDRPNECAVWTFYRITIPRVQSENAAEDFMSTHCTLDYIEIDPRGNLGACEPRGEAPSADPDEWCVFNTDDCDDAALAWLYEQETLDHNVSEPQPDEDGWYDAADYPLPSYEEAEPQIVSIGKPDARGMQLVRWSNGSVTWRRLEKLEFSQGIQGEQVTQVTPKKAQQDAPAEPQSSGKAHYTNIGATYEPGRDWTNDVRAVPSWMRTPGDIGLVRMREMPEGTLNVLAGDPEEDDPLVRCAPVEPVAAAKYYALRNKKAVSPAQRRALDIEADKLMIWLPASEAPEVRPREPTPSIAGRWGGRRARSQARGRRPPVEPTTAALWGN